MVGISELKIREKRKFWRKVRTIFKNANLLLASLLLGTIPTGFEGIYERHKSDKEKFIEEIRNAVLSHIKERYPQASTVLKKTVISDSHGIWADLRAQGYPKEQAEKDAFTNVAFFDPNTNTLYFNTDKMFLQFRVIRDTKIPQEIDERTVHLLAAQTITHEVLHTFEDYLHPKSNEQLGFLDEAVTHLFACRIVEELFKEKMPVQATRLEDKKGVGLIAEEYENYAFFAAELEKVVGTEVLEQSFFGRSTKKLAQAWNEKMGNVIPFERFYDYFLSIDGKIDDETALDVLNESKRKQDSRKRIRLNVVHTDDKHDQEETKTQKRTEDGEVNTAPDPHFLAAKKALEGVLRKRKKYYAEITAKEIEANEAEYRRNFLDTPAYLVAMRTLQGTFEGFSEYCAARLILDTCIAAELVEYIPDHPLTSEEVLEIIEQVRLTGHETPSELGAYLLGQATKEPFKKAQCYQWIELFQTSGIHIGYEMDPSSMELIELAYLANSVGGNVILGLNSGNSPFLGSGILDRIVGIILESTNFSHVSTDLTFENELVVPDVNLLKRALLERLERITRGRGEVDRSSEQSKTTKEAATYKSFERIGGIRLLHLPLEYSRTYGGIMRYLRHQEKHQPFTRYDSADERVERYHSIEPFIKRVIFAFDRYKSYTYGVTNSVHFRNSERTRQLFERYRRRFESRGINVTYQSLSSAVLLDMNKRQDEKDVLTSSGEAVERIANEATPTGYRELVEMPFLASKAATDTSRFKGAEYLRPRKHKHAFNWYFFVKVLERTFSGDIVVVYPNEKTARVSRDGKFRPPGRRDWIAPDRLYAMELAEVPPQLMEKVSSIAGTQEQTLLTKLQELFEEVKVGGRTGIEYESWPTTHLNGSFTPAEAYARKMGNCFELSMLYMNSARELVTRLEEEAVVFGIDIMYSHYRQEIGHICVGILSKNLKGVTNPRFEDDWIFRKRILQQFGLKDDLSWQLLVVDTATATFEAPWTGIRPICDEECTSIFYANSGYFFSKRGEVERATEAYNTAIVHYPLNQSAAFVYMKECILEGRYDDAIQYGMRFQDIEHKAFVEELMAIAAYKKGDLESTEKFADAVVRKSEASYLGYLLLGLSRLNPSYPGGSIPIFERALDIITANLADIEDVEEGLKEAGKREDARIENDKKEAVQMLAVKTAIVTAVLLERRLNEKKLMDEVDREKFCSGSAVLTLQLVLFAREHTTPNERVVYGLGSEKTHVFSIDNWVEIIKTAPVQERIRVAKVIMKKISEEKELEKVIENMQIITG